MRTDGAFTLSAQNMAYENGSWWLQVEQFFQKTKDLPIKCIEVTRKTFIGHP